MAQIACFITSFGQTKGGKLYNIIMQNVIKANQKTESFCFRWVGAQALFKSSRTWCKTIVTTFFYITNYNGFAPSPQHAFPHLSEHRKSFQALSRYVTSNCKVPHFSIVWMACSTASICGHWSVSSCWRTSSILPWPSDWPLARPTTRKLVPQNSSVFSDLDFSAS